MRRPQGYFSSTSNDTGKVISEGDTCTCSHCNGIVFVGAKQDPSEIGGFCRMCMRNVCARCNAKGSCTPFEKKLEAMERRERLILAMRT